jgi:hypothetical protein
MDAADRRLARPDALHRRHVAAGEGRIEGLVGIQNRLFIAHRFVAPHGDCRAVSLHQARAGKNRLRPALCLEMTGRLA